VPYLTIAVGGGVQPDRLEAALLKGPDDGMASRFLYLYPDATPPIRPSRIAKDGPARSAFARLLALQMTADQNGEPAPVVVPLEDIAAKVFHEWRLSHAPRERECSGLMLSWLGKMPGYVLRIALVLELMDWAIELKPDPVSRVSVDSVRRAIRFVDTYCIPMAERTFGDAGLPDAERHASMIARLIIARRIGETHTEGVVVNARDIRRQKMQRLRTADAVSAAINHLVEVGWLQAIPSRAGSAPGRQRADYLVNPAVWRTAKEQIVEREVS
jgi:hypothetical protein